MACGLAQGVEGFGKAGGLALGVFDRRSTLPSGVGAAILEGAERSEHADFLGRGAQRGAVMTRGRVKIRNDLHASACVIP
jgi:hypothetical protein